MTAGPLPSPTPVSERSHDRGLAAIVGLLIVAFVGLAIDKPWGGTPAGAATTPSSSAASPAPGASDASPRGPSPTETQPVQRQIALPVAFALPTPPPVSADWTGLRWRRLASNDPLSLVTKMLRWRGGYVAVGYVSRLPETPVWTSADGSQWEPLPFNTATTPWPGSQVLGVADVTGGLAALTETAVFCGQPCTPTYVPPVVSWTSADGMAWESHVIPPEWFGNRGGSPPLVATGSNGVIVATPGVMSQQARSVDGSHWVLLPDGAFPASFEVDTIAGFRRGYVALGRWQDSGATAQAAVLWSADGTHWPKAPALLPSPSGSRRPPVVPLSVVRGSDGLIAVGRYDTGLGGTVWWQSSDGRRWHLLEAYPPLGAASPRGLGASPQPDGALVGDGRQLVAVRGGQDAAGWTSGDGLTWRMLAMSGDVPSDQARAIALLPGGVLVGDGIATWFGQAMVGASP